MLQACLNGGRSRAEHSAVPVTPAELAADARACVAAGAQALHVHPRDERGEETLDAARVGAALSAMREAAPGIELSVTTGLWIEGDATRRLARVEAWTTQPDVASVNFKEPGAVELCRLLLDRGIGVEAGVATAADTRRLIASGLAPRCRRVLVEVDGLAPASLGTVRWIDTLLDQARVTIPRLDHGYDAATWSVVETALRSGRHARIGLEDTLVMAGGETASDNASLVAATARITAARATPAG